MRPCRTGFFPADILLPRGCDMTRWSVVACDQFTSEPEYWEECSRLAGDAPSALRLILPEVYLNAPDVETRIRDINAAMQDYLDRDLFTVYPSAMIYTERTQSDGRIRRGLVGAVDLEEYDFLPGSSALIRATEGTVLERIPPRVRVRRDAPLELPHIMLLIDDERRRVIEPLAEETAGMRKVYDFELMQGGGHLRGFLLSRAQQQRVRSGLAALCAPKRQAERYRLPGAAPLLFAVGDGNHSLATAKRCYEQQKECLSREEALHLPSRFALAEVVNNHDEALDFEPIHRVLFGVDPAEMRSALLSAWPGARLTPELLPLSNREEAQTLRFLYGDRQETLVIPQAPRRLAVGTLQTFLDGFLRSHAGTVDYIHDDDAALRLAAAPGCCGFLLPPMRKDELFGTVMADGVLPRKTFSMGHARDKRYYTEARRLK